MNEAHWYLVVNHLPVIFPLVGIIVMIKGKFFKIISSKANRLHNFYIRSAFSFFCNEYWRRC